MVDNSTDAAQPGHAQVVTLPNGTPVVIKTETQVPVTPPKSNDAMFNVTQAGVYLGFVALLVTCIIGAMKWLDGKLEKLGLRVGEELKEVRSDVKDTERRILEGERAIVELDKRLSLQEAESRAIKDGQDRIEDRLEKMERDSKEGRAEIIDTIREMSTRELRPQ